MGQCKSCGTSSSHDLSEGTNQFNVTVSRAADESLGIELDFMDMITGRVIELDEAGTISKAGTPLKSGDHILAVNGISTALRIMKRLKEDELLDMLVERPTEFKIDVLKGETGVGLDLTHAPRGNTLLIRNLTNTGAIKQWNDKNSAAQVRRHDRIVEVNGRRGKAQVLLDELKSKDELSIIISPAPRTTEEVLNPQSVPAEYVA